MPVWKGCVMKACLPCVHNRWDRIEAGGVWQGTISLPEGQSESPTSWLALSFGAAGVTQQRAQAFPAGSSELGRNPRSLHGAAPKTKAKVLLLFKRRELPKVIPPVTWICPPGWRRPMKVGWTLYGLVKTSYIIKRANSPCKARYRRL